MFNKHGYVCMYMYVLNEAEGPLHSGESCSMYYEQD